MISVNNLSLYFGGQDIFKDISFMINKGDKIGLVGKNGSGKSTLLKILSSNIDANSGNLSIDSKVLIGYLKQDLDFEYGRTVMEEAQTAFQDLIHLKEQMKVLNDELINRNDYETDSYLELITKFNEAEEAFRIRGGHDVHAQVVQILKGLGFSEIDFDRKTDEFSGGWRMRIELAKLLLKKPDVLLLDEPTNHLDIESIIWLENWLEKYTGSIVLVSHDKQFLDVITNRTIELSFCKINNYKASYSKYLELRKDRIEKQKQAKKNQDKYIEHTKVLINKFRAKKNKAAFAQTLITKLERLDIIEVEKEDFSKVRFQFPPAPHSGKISMKLDKIEKSYDDLKVLSNVSLEIVRGDRIAFVGKNGEGKTTLAKIIANEIDFKGSAKPGHNMQLGYYAQNQTDYLDGESTILQTIEAAADFNTSSKVRDILGSFLFSNDEVDKKIKVLSGGERARVSLCKLLLKPANLLIMDEPTNHLDIISKDILKKALLNFDGSLIIVSHDREFLQGLTEKVYEFKNQQLKEHIGDINTFLNERNLADFKQLESLKEGKKSEKDSLHHNHKDQQKKIRKLQNDVSKLEKKINSLESELKEMNNQLLEEKDSQSKDQSDFFKNYQKIQDEISVLVKKWEVSMQKLEDSKV